MPLARRGNRSGWSSGGSRGTIWGRLGRFGVRRFGVRSIFSFSFVRVSLFACADQATDEPGPHWIQMDVTTDRPEVRFVFHHFPFEPPLEHVTGVVMTPAPPAGVPAQPILHTPVMWPTISRSCRQRSLFTPAAESPGSGLPWSLESVILMSGTDSAR